MSMSKKKPNNYNFPPLQNFYKVFEGSSINGSITRKYYYINGRKCDAFGRTINEVGFTPVRGVEKNVPISYPLSEQNIKSSSNPKKNFYKTWGMDQDLLLEINKKKIIQVSEQEVNIRASSFIDDQNEKLIIAKKNSKSIYSKIFNPLNKNITDSITNNNLLYYYSKYPIQVSRTQVPKTAFKSLNIKDDIQQNFMSTN